MLFSIQLVDVTYHGTTLQCCYFGKEACIQQAKDRLAAGAGQGHTSWEGGHPRLPQQRPVVCSLSVRPLQSWQRTACFSPDISVVDSSINLRIPVEKFRWGCDLDSRRKIRSF